MFAVFPALHERRGQRARTLSGGERRQVAVGRGLMRDAGVLLIDEPSLGLAPVIIETVYETIGRIAEQDVSILLVEENFTHIEALADQVLRVRDGPHRADRQAGRARGRRDARPLLPGGAAAVTDLISILVSTVVLGSIYALVTVGMTLIYGILRVLDMSQGSMVMVGGFVGWAIMTSAGLSPLLAVLAAFLATFALGILTQLVSVQPLLGRRGLDFEMITFITTFAVAIIMANVALQIAGPAQRSPAGHRRAASGGSTA